MAFETDDREETAPRTPPMIVIQYRRNWWSTLLPPLLVLLAAVGVARYRVESPDWGIWWSPRPAAMPGPAVPAAAAHAAPTTPLAEPGPLVARIEEAETIPPATTADEPPPAEEVRARPPSPALGFVPPAGRADRPAGNRPGSPFDMTDAATDDRRDWPALPEPPPPTVVAEGEDDADEEARRIHEERTALGQLKDRLLEQERRDLDAKQREQARVAARKNTSSRPDFHRELRAILDSQGRHAGAAIRDLCNRHGRDVPTVAVLRAHRIFSGSAAIRLDPASRVEILRALAWPEAMILDELAHQQERTIGTRHGPKNREEALVVAARRLVAMPLDRERPATAVLPVSADRRGRATP